MNSRNRPPGPADPRDFLISRRFEAPRERLWKAWLDPKQLVRWWGPRAMGAVLCEVDGRTGGAYRIVMQGRDGIEYPVQGRFVELLPPERLVMTIDCGEHPGSWHDLVDPVRGSNPNPVGEFVQTVTFEDDSGGTRVTVHTRFANPGIREAMGRIGMAEGWSESLDRLAEFLATPRKARMPS